MPDAVNPQDDQHAASIAYQRAEEENSPLSEMMGTLPGIVSRGLLYIILSFTTLGFAWAAFHEIDIIVAVQATVIPEGKLKIIQPPFTGTVQEIRVREGDRVRAGDILIVYQSSAVSDLLVDLKAEEAEMAWAKKAVEETLPKKIAAIESLMAKERQKFAQQELIHKKNLLKSDEQIHRLGLETLNAQGRLKLIGREVEVNEKLAKKGFVTERKMLELKRVKEEIAIEIERLRSAIKEAQVTKEIEVAKFNLDGRTHQVKLAEYQEENENLRRAAGERYDMAKIQFEQALDRAELNLSGVNREIIEMTRSGLGNPTDTAVIEAPIDGIVAELGVRNPGEMIERGQTVITLVPDGVSLITELQIPDRDVGKVREGQPIKFKFAAFPFADHGVLTGQVEAMSPSAIGIDEQNGTFYRAESQLNQHYFRVNGDKVYLLPGMTAMAEIRTERKSVLELVLKPFAELREPHQAEK